MGARTAEISRKTNETDIRLRLDLDGCGEVRINTGVGFFDHMLTLLCRHALINAEITAAGDIEVDGALRRQRGNEILSGHGVLVVMLVG